MARLDSDVEPLSPYERAACYYTLPRIAPSIPAAFVFLYGGLLLTLLGALCLVAVYGTARATYTLVLVVVLTAFAGILAVMARGVVHEIRSRRVLQEAHNAPQVQSYDDTLPDPFANHVLLRHPGNPIGKLTACTSDNLDIEYFLDNTGEGSVWEVRTPQDEEMLTVRATGGVGSFAFVSTQAKRFGVYVGEVEVARIEEGGSLLNPSTNIVCHTPHERTYAVRDGGIHLAEKLVGRVYYVRRAFYLDIEKDHLNEGTLGYFVSLV